MGFELDFGEWEAVVLVALAALGGALVARWMLGLALDLFFRGLRPARSPTSFGKWVAITGATDGIGKAMAFEYASRGMNVLLLSRTEAKLVAVEKELQDKFGDVEVRHVAVDFSAFDSTAQAEVRAALEALDSLGVLVNNVGASYPFPMYFHELSEEELAFQLKLNVEATTAMIRLALPIMLSNERGAIVNIGSGAGLRPSPLLAVYSASKAYVETLSHALHVEYASRGISVQCHTPLFIVSKLSKFRKPSAFVPSPETYAREAMATLGKGAVVSPHRMHRISWAVARLLPLSVFQARTLKYHLSIRAKGMRKRARRAGEGSDPELGLEPMAK